MSLPERLPWHDAQWQRVLAARRQQRLGHALLLAGPRGVGKRMFAEGLAALLLCEDPPSDEPCGTCRSCVLSAAGPHPDFTVIEPEEGKQDIAVEAARALGAKLALYSHYGRAKVAMIAPAEALNMSSINALLKTVEEPSDKTCLLLIAASPLVLPATLRSRCQLLRFPRPTPAAALDWLSRRTPELNPQALGAALGAPLNALSLAETGSLERYEHWRGLLERLSAGDEGPVAAADRIGKEQAPEFVAWWLAEMWRNARSKPVTSESGSLERLYRAGVEARRRLDGNASPQLVIESLLIAWWEMLRAHRNNARNARLA